MRYGFVTAAAFAAFTLAATTGVAGATTITESATTGGLQTTDFSDTLSLAGFNSSLGTLTGVSITLSDAGTFNGTVTNTATNNNTFKFTEDTNVSASGNSVIAGLSNDLAQSQTYTNVPTGVPNIFGPYSLTNSDSVSAITASDIAEFLNKNITVVVATLTGNAVSGGGGNAIASINTKADATITLVYTYTAKAPPPVPEPASLAVLGMGLLGLGFVRAKSSKNV